MVLDVVQHTDVFVQVSEIFMCRRQDVLTLNNFFDFAVSCTDLEK